MASSRCVLTKDEMMEFDGLLLSMVYLMDVVEIYLVVNFVVMRHYR